MVRRCRTHVVEELQGEGGGAGSRSLEDKQVMITFTLFPRVTLVALGKSGVIRVNWVKNVQC